MQTIVAIDVGSNAIRIGVGHVSSGQDQAESIDNTRIPVCLGQDVFSSGHITEPGMQAALDAFLRLRKIADQFEVKQIRAATSATREAVSGGCGRSQPRCSYWQGYNEENERELATDIAWAWQSPP